MLTVKAVFNKLRGEYLKFRESHAYRGLVQDISGFERSESHYTVLCTIVRNSWYSSYYIFVSYTIDILQILRNAKTF